EAGELKLDVKRAQLARDPIWLPAVENRGEGVFLGFNSQAIDAWKARPDVQARGRELDAGFRAWLAHRNLDPSTPWPGLPYVMLHSLSHLLITSVSLSCGYSASALRERVYAGSSGYGILILTGGSGAEGTLGGLVDVGRRIEEHLLQAIEYGRLCSNDPVCSHHSPQSELEQRYLQGAACHGCLLMSETSCERRNDHLDRALVVPTLSTPGVAFLGGT
ncbi:MAG: DUF1998 domain-containing protein, partial [Deltaproteobacteria bacterium]|nr:DUF1998 domain-containing protein [Deltaproteobacteria bacterium]